MNIDFARQWLSTLQEIPKSLNDTMYQTAVSLSERYADLSDFSIWDVLSYLNLQALLPPLMSVLTIYFTIISLYHTTSFLFRCTVFLVKWITLIGVFVSGVGFIANVFGVFNPNIWSPGSSEQRRHMTKPRPWDTFQQHQQWSAESENQYIIDAGRAAREMVEKLIGAAAQSVWWSSLGGMAANPFAQRVSTPVVARNRRLEASGKGTIR